MARKDDCIFCTIARGELKSEKVMHSDNFFVVRDVHPAAEGHSLIIPKRHFVTLLDIPDKLGVEFLTLTKKVAGSLMDAKKGDGFNIVMNNLAVAGQVVMHAHVHVIPRNEGDGLDIRFKRKG
jgi:histidine triad (HIT) family protein